MKHFVLILIIGLLLGCAACRSGDIRGSSKPSRDGKTYLVVADDNGGACPLNLDGKLWSHAKGQAGRVDAGRHVISSCGSDISFNVPEGSVYTFDYWGP